MAKEVETFIKLQVKGGQANPAPSSGSCTWCQRGKHHGVLQAFQCKTQDQQGQVLPVVITVFKDKSF
jgi:large subunit ribosomal protein L11